MFDPYNWRWSEALIWRCAFKEFMYLVFTRMPCRSYRRLGPCCCVPCYSCEVCPALFLPFVCRSETDLDDAMVVFNCRKALLSGCRWIRGIKLRTKALKMNADKMPMVWVSWKPYVCSSCMKDEQFSRSSIRSITSVIHASRTHYLARTCSKRAISINNMEAMLLKAELYRRLACCPQNGQTIAFWGKPSMESYIRDALNLASSQTSPASQRKEYRSKTHKRLKERFLIRRNRTKRANFRCNNLFRATYNTTENT